MLDHNSKFFFFNYFVILDLYLFQAIILLNPCLGFSKNSETSKNLQNDYYCIHVSTSNDRIYSCDIIMMFYQYTEFCPRKIKFYFTVYCTWHDKNLQSVWFSNSPKILLFYSVFTRPTDSNWTDKKNVPTNFK